MGGGRRTETYLGPHPPHAGSPSSSAAASMLSYNCQFLNLPPGELASIIFGCTHATYEECVTQLLFGLPQIHFSYIQHIRPGMPLFLFNYTDRMLHGIFEADSCGELNINPYAWTGNGGKTQYAAQARVRVKHLCSPLPEKVFKEAIIANYLKNPQRHFCFELNHVQTDKLLSLFRRDNTTMNSPHITAQVRPSSWPQGDNENGWIKPKKNMKAALNAWHNAAPFVPTSNQTLEVQNENRVATPEHWYDNQENTDDNRASENAFNNGFVAENSLENGVQSAIEGSLDWRVEVLSSNVTSSEGLEHSKAEKERVVVEKLLQLKQKGKQIISEVKVEVPEVKEMTNGGSLASVSQEGECSRTEWEKLARERCLQEQNMLRREREQLKEKLQAVDGHVARAISMNLELSANAIAQVRQDEIKLRHLMDEAMSQTELLHELAQLKKTNATLEYTQVKMASEIEGLKSEMKRMSLHMKDMLEHNGKVNYISQQSDPVGSSDRHASQFDGVVGEESWQQIYLLGGYDVSSWLDRMDVFYPATYEMTYAAPMSVSRSYAAACTLMGSIYVFGGGNGALWYDTVEMYNPDTDEWTQCSPMSQKKGNLAGATVGDRIYAVGGGIGEVYFSEVECYDAHLGTWIGSTSMLNKRFGVSAVELNGALYAIGGFNDHYLASVERYDPREALWTAVAPMTRRRGNFSAVTLDENIYAIGGFDGKQFLRSVELYEPRRNIWIESDSELLKGRAFAAAARAGKDIFIFGGYDGGYLDSVECYTEGSSRGWETIDEILLGSRSFHSCVMLE